MKDIEQFLRDNAPETPEEGQFLLETNARLNAVEGIKKTVDGERRRGRIALIAALVAGIVIGSGVTLVLTLYPIDSLQLSPDVTKVVEGMRNYKEVFWVLIAVCSVALGVVSMRKRERAF